MEFRGNTNIFRNYKQKENQFTNGLFSILDLSMAEDKSFINDFFKKTLGIKIPKDDLSFKILRDYEGTSDAEISNDKLYFLVETKIKSGSLREDQIKSHMKIIKKKKQKIKGLILFTPDNSGSEYIRQYLSINKNMIYHVNWKGVYDYLNDYVYKQKSTFTNIISQYLSMIHDTIFEQDIVAVILKIAFGDKTGIYPNEYLDKMSSSERAKWGWGTPRRYKNLDGEGRKLILYDRTRQALTVEVEIKEIKKQEGSAYPYRNIFVPNSLRIYEKSIPLTKIRKINGFENFGIHRKDRNPIRNLTHEQYEELIKN